MTGSDPDFPAGRTGSTGSSAAKHWLIEGVRAGTGVPALILASAFVGFAGLAKEAGLSLAQTVFMVVTIWALPAKVVLVGSIMSGASLPAAAFAVALSSVRLMPMVVALVPDMRTEKTRSWVLYALSHFIAVTAWVIALERFRHVPREYRTTFFAGLGTTLIVTNSAVTAAVFLLATNLPPVVNAALFFLTPLYFLTSLWGSARERAGHLAMIFGLVLGPAFHMIVPEFDLVAAGLIGGVGAYLFHLQARRRQTA